MAKIKAKPGAKLKLTPTLQENICKKIKLGCTKRYAALSSGIKEPTFYEWLAKGEKQKTGVFAEFREAIKRAEAEAIASYELELRKRAHEGNMMATIFYLQNRAPETWKDRRVLEHSGPERGPISIRVVFETEEEARGGGEDSQGG